jgi:hypothetical protein
MISAAALPICLFFCLQSIFVFAQDSSQEQQLKINLKLQEFKVLGSDPQVVAAVKNYNTSGKTTPHEMTNEKWKSISMLDPLVKTLIKNDLVPYLKGKTDDTVSELFISGADGGKICFYSKTTSWTHKGKPKHEIPMTGKAWVGPLEIDQSTGIQQVQTSFPVLDHHTPIGSIVIGINTSKLK